MIVTEQQNDALAELINIAFGRTGAALSDLTGQRVALEPPQVEVHSTETLYDALSRFIPGEVASVHQVFTGQVEGDALLLLNHDGAVHLTDLLTDEPLPSKRLDESAREVLTEVGNILLNACLGMFGNMLNVRMSFSVPRLHLETLSELLSSVVAPSEELRYALVVFTAFQIKESEVSGYLVLVLSVSSLDRLVHEVEAWEERQGRTEAST